MWINVCSVHYPIHGQHKFSSLCQSPLQIKLLSFKMYKEKPEYWAWTCTQNPSAVFESFPFICQIWMFNQHVWWYCKLSHLRTFSKTKTTTQESWKTLCPVPFYLVWPGPLLSLAWNAETGLAVTVSISGVHSWAFGTTATSSVVWE